MNNILYQNILKTIDRTIQKTLFEYEQFHLNDELTLKEYDKVNSEDFDYISINRKMIWEFFENGYKAAGLTGFCNSCVNPNALRKNFTKIKLVYYKDILVAGSIYTGYKKGYKCVGITATTDEAYREIGKEGIKYIIKQDIGLYKDFYWGVFDGAVSHYYEKFGGILIPNDYCQLFINAEKDPDDEYKIIVKLTDGTKLPKLIYGFNSKETFDDIVQHNDERVKEQLDRLEMLLHPDTSLNESLYRPITEEDYHVRVINTFFDNFLYGQKTLTPYMVKMINRSKNFLINYLKNNNNPKDRDYYYLAVENAKDILKYSMRMKLHKF